MQVANFSGYLHCDDITLSSKERILSYKLKKKHIKKLQKKRVARDRRITVLITAGGWLVLLTLVLLLWHLISASSPILRAPSLKAENTYRLPQQSELLAVSEVNGEETFLIRDSECHLRLMRANRSDGSLNTLRLYPGECEDEIQVLANEFGFYIADIRKLNRFRTRFIDPYSGSFRMLQLISMKLSDMVPRLEKKAWHFSVMRDSIGLYFEGANNSAQVININRRNFDIEYQTTLKKSSAVAFLNNRNSILTFRDGFFQIADKQRIFQSSQRYQHSVNHLAITPGNNSFLSFNEDQVLEKWGIINTDIGPDIQSFYQVQLPVAISHVTFSSNNELALLSSGDILLFFNTTTGEIIADHEFHEPSTNMFYSKDFIYAEHDNEIHKYALLNGAATITFKSLWQQIWFDGYQGEEYVWQTSGASDFQQAKYSIVPLLIGSAKAAFLALIIAIPLGIGSAIYSAFLAPKYLRNKIKPVVEMIEGVPSVVIGFIAALWLFPLSEMYLLGLLVFILLMPLLLGLFIAIAENAKQYFRVGWELLAVSLMVLFFIVLFDYWVSQYSPVVTWFWEESTATAFLTQLVSKNNLVLAIALGVAIAPTIYSLADDAIYEVPQKLKLASFSMGATRVQTLQKVILKAAFPGLVSAVILGFARAVGETMIVLMVSGNTPIANWSLLEGMRTLTANLAIELPETEVGGIHYQILFLTALILFIFTFVINTIAELLRQRMRRKYALV